MVIVEGRNDFDRKMIDRKKCIADVARELFGNFSVRQPDSHNVTGFVVKEGIFFSPLDNRITIDSQKDYKDAIKLAETYEKRYGERVTLKKTYED